MTIHLEAIYENGVFRPLQPVDLPERHPVALTIDAQGEGDLAIQTTFALSPERWDAFCEALDAPPRNIPALRQLLTQPGVLDDNGTPR